MFITTLQTAKQKIPEFMLKIYDQAKNELVDFYEMCFEKYGRQPKGLDWPNAEDLQTRSDVMLSFLDSNSKKVNLLDLGCGPGLLLDHIHNRREPSNRLH